MQPVDDQRVHDRVVDPERHARLEEPRLAEQIAVAEVHEAVRRCVRLEEHRRGPDPARIRDRAAPDGWCRRRA